jgi:hypothetical protein
MNLAPVPIRILGSLIEKEATTPDAYPLSLNALTAACNQLSNREPVMQLPEVEVRNAVNALRQEGLVRAIQPSGSKVMKFQHLLTEKLNLDARERAILGVLMLRGPQTLAEIRSRTGRLAEFAAIADVESTIAELVKRDLVGELGRQPGQKETRYAQLLGGPPAEPPVAEEPAIPSGVHRESISELKASVEDLKRELAELRASFEDFRREFS